MSVLEHWKVLLFNIRVINRFGVLVCKPNISQPETWKKKWYIISRGLCCILCPFSVRLGFKSTTLLQYILIFYMCIVILSLLYWWVFTASHVHLMWHWLDGRVVILSWTVSGFVQYTFRYCLCEYGRLDIFEICQMFFPCCTTAPPIWDDESKHTCPWYIWCACNQLAWSVQSTCHITVRAHMGHWNWLAYTDYFLFVDTA